MFLRLKLKIDECSIRVYFGAQFHLKIPLFIHKSGVTNFSELLK